MLATIIYNIYIEHTKHEYTVETIIQFAVEPGTERTHPNLYLQICNARQQTHMNISHENLLYANLMQRKKVILREHRVTNIHIHL
jgi:hypothetical protein